MNAPGEPNYCGACKSDGFIIVEAHPPHATKEEAYLCATTYVLDTARWDRTVDTKAGVPRCDMPDCDTLVHDGGAVDWGFGMSALTVLCSDHRNRECLATIVGTLGQVISS